MNKFLVCVLYVVIIGILSNPVASLVKRDNIDYTRFPYCTHSFEKGGRLYDKIGIRRWKDKVPDMSNFLKNLVKKEIKAESTSADILRQIQETCVAEMIHFVLILLSLAVFFYWRSKWAILFEAIYIFILNLPFILIQRYNRPRLIKLYQRKLRSES